MFILTACERWTLLVLCLFVFISAGFVSWTESGPKAVCHFPAEFTAEMSDYGKKVCATRLARHYGVKPSLKAGGKIDKKTEMLLAPSEWADGVAFRLSMVAILLTLPLIIFHLLERLSKAVKASGKSLSMPAIIVRGVAELVGRMILIVSICIALMVLQMESPRWPGSETTTDEDSEIPWISQLLTPEKFYDPPQLLVCSYDIQKFAKRMTFSIQCMMEEGQRVAVARIAIFLVWRFLAVAAVWIVMTFLETIILVVCPTTRRAVLKIKPEDRKSRSEVSKFSTGEEQHS